MFNLEVFVCCVMIILQVTEENAVDNSDSTADVSSGSTSEVHATGMLELDEQFVTCVEIIKYDAYFV